MINNDSIILLGNNLKYISKLNSLGLSSIIYIILDCNINKEGTLSLCNNLSYIQELKIIDLNSI